MAAKIELEIYASGKHPHPQYLRHHLSSHAETLAKRPNIEGTELASDGIPEETARKAIYSSAMNGHTNTDIITDTHPCVKSGTVFTFSLGCFQHRIFI